MTTKTKRTYNLSAETVAHVRDLVEQVDSATSQDAVVEIAIERLYRDVRDREEAALWAKAAEDPEFRMEMRSIATAYRDRESWPS
ncbi:MAG: hypothetical protein ACC726_08890 [Chloroflexota bacterium]